MLERTESMAHLASFEWDAVADVTTWSPEMFRIFRRDPALGVPDLAGQQELYTPESTQRLYAAVEKALAEGLPYELELMTVQPDGEQRPGFVIAYPERNAQGKVVRISGLVQDVTERRNHEKECLKIEKLESLGVLAGGIAHDFNNILTGIMGNISLALQMIEPHHQAHQRLKDAEKASKRAGELAQQLLTFARGGDPVKRTVLVQKVIQESVSLVLSGSTVKAQVEVADSLQTIEADEGQICQVFNNILINATQALPAGGIVEISARNETLPAENAAGLPPGPYVKISFADPGVGIAADVLQKIFDPYFTTKPTGTGLGLASAHSIISRHGGKITATSTVGVGTTFHIVLPSSGKTSAEEAPAGQKTEAGAHRGGAVLVMDDEPMIRDLATQMLAHLGYQAVTCAEGSQAVSLYRAALETGSPFVAVIMDLTIPAGMGGKEAARSILAIDRSAYLIVSSGYSTDPIMADFAAYGFRAVVAKPYSMAEFQRLLGSLARSWFFRTGFCGTYAGFADCAASCRSAPAAPLWGG